MEIHKLFTEDRAVSPVVGVALLIAIAVILAAVIGAVVLGLGTTGADTPQAQLNADTDASLDEIEIYHRGGDKLETDEVVLVTPNDRHALQTELRAGESVTEGDFEGTPAFGPGVEVSLVWEDPNSDSETVIETWEAE